MGSSINSLSSRGSNTIGAEMAAGSWKEVYYTGEGGEFLLECDYDGGLDSLRTTQDQ